MYVVGALCRDPVCNARRGNHENLDMSVRTKTTGYVAQITLDRQEALNALDVEDLLALRHCLQEARDDVDVRAIILTGAGEKSFCVGADLKGTSPPETNFAETCFLSIERSSRMGHYARLFDLSDLDISKPMIAAVNGYCLGGGLELALQCDLRVASSTARFGLPEARVASIPAAGGIQYLLRAIPSAVAMKMLLTGEHIDSQRAAEIGLVSDLYAPNDLPLRAQELADQIAKNGPLAVQMIKTLAKDSANMRLSEALKMTETGWGILRDTNDRKEGRKAFAEKRKAIYEGR